MIHLGTWPWSSYSNGEPLDPGEYTNLATVEKDWLRGLGPVPVLAVIYANQGLGHYTPQTPLWLAEHGFREATVRLMLDTASAEHPQPLQGDMQALALACVEQMEYWLRWDTNIDCIFQVDCEPDLERRVQAPAEYVARLDELISHLAAIFPGRHFLRPPVAQDSPWADAFLAAMLPGYRAQPFVLCHYYWNRQAGDKAAGVKWSPEWLADYCGKPAIVTECGSKGDRADVDEVFRRWLTDPRIARWHWWKLGGESYVEDNWTVEMANYAIAFAHDLYRPLRAWPRTEALPPPAPADVDLAALTGVVHRIWATRDLLINERGRHSAVESIVIDDLFREIVDYKQVLGI